MKISAAVEKSWTPRQNHPLLLGTLDFDTDGRKATGYRDYENKSLQKLVFIQRMRTFGFSIDECQEHLGLYEDQNCSRSYVKHLSNLRLKDIQQKQKGLLIL